MRTSPATRTLTSNANNVFITTWKTDNTSTGSSGSNQVMLPLHSGGTYNFVVSWGDGTKDTITTWNQAQTTHTYTNIGTYTIRITGTCTGWRFNNTGDRLKLLTVVKFGTTFNFGNLGNYFHGCANLNFHPNCDAPNLTGTTNFSRTFHSCTIFNSPLALWDVSSCTDFTAVFANSPAFNQPIGSWNTANVTTMTSMFFNATSSNFNQDIGSWNVGNVTNTANMFSGATAFNQNLNSWNTSKVTTMLGMFTGATAFNSPIGNWNTANVTTMANMFQNATNFNQNISSWNTAKVTNMATMFNTATNFNQDISSWNTGLVTNMSYMFQLANAFNQPIGNWNTSNVTTMQQMFQLCDSFNQPLNFTLNANVVMTLMLSSNGMSCENYTQTITNWANQSITGRTLGATSRQYGTNGVSARDTLVTTLGWTITGDSAFAGTCP